MTSTPSTDVMRRLRKEFEIPRTVVFLNHASFGPVPKRGRLAVEELLRRQGRFTEDPDVDAESYTMLDTSRRMFARLIGLDPRHVAFSPNASYGLNAILWGMRLKAGEIILVPRNEFPAVVYAVRSLAERSGVTMREVPCPDGWMTLAALEKKLRSEPSVLVISWVQFFNGYRNDLRAITSLCHSYGCAVIVDATQGAGAIPLNMRKDGFDALACGAQKWLFGQTGAGFLAIAPDPVRPIAPLFGGWLGYDWGYRWGDLQRWNRPAYSDGRIWEVGTYPYYSVRLAHSGLSIISEIGTRSIFKHVQSLLTQLEETLANTRYRVGIFPNRPNRSCIVSVAGPDTARLHKTLEAKRIYTSLREGNIRVSPHFYNTESDIRRLAAEIVRFDRPSHTR